MKKKVIIASTNPVKVKVAEKAFASVFPETEFEFVPVKSESGVPDQPINEQTLEGARNRLKFVQNKYPDADYWISQEGGLYKEEGKMFVRAWIAACDKEGFVTESSTSNFNLPPGVKKHIEEGLELAHAHDKHFGTVNSGQSTGAVGHLTDGLVDRTEYYMHSAIIVLSEI
jgi:inosine/xanthosine triphosphatase